MRASVDTCRLPRVTVATRVLGGRYKLVEPLGHGGMAVVWRAHDRVLGRQVAVKLLAGRHAGEPGARQRIRDEARAAAALSHPNVVQVYDYGEWEDAGERLPYVVMELARGDTLEQRQVAGPLSPRFAMRIAAEVGAGLAAAHAEGLVHRDVKPANVMLTSQGAKVVDFGIAAAICPSGARQPDGELFGTPAYLAPERLTDDAVSPASDVYALGVLLYRLLSGESPWTADTTTEMLAAHIYVDPEPLAPVPGVPDYIVELCNRCLSKDPTDRPSARDAAALLAHGAGMRVIDDDRPVPAAVGPADAGEPSVLIRRTVDQVAPAPEAGNDQHAVGTSDPTPDPAGTGDPSDRDRTGPGDPSDRDRTGTGDPSQRDRAGTGDPPPPDRANTVGPTPPSRAGSGGVPPAGRASTGEPPPPSWARSGDPLPAGRASAGNPTAPGRARSGDPSPAGRVRSGDPPPAVAAGEARPGSLRPAGSGAALVVAPRSPVGAAGGKRARRRWLGVAAAILAFGIAVIWLLGLDHRRDQPTANPAGDGQAIGSGGDPAPGGVAPSGLGQPDPGNLTPPLGAAVTTGGVGPAATAGPAAAGVPVPGTTGAGAPGAGVPGAGAPTAGAPTAGGAGGPGGPVSTTGPHEPGPTTTAAPQERTLSSTGGTVRAICPEPTVARLLSWTPARSYRVESVDAGPAATTTVTFQHGKESVIMTVTCDGGVPRAR